MTASKSVLTDELLNAALSGRAAGQGGSAELIDDVLIAVRSTSQRGSWGLQVVPVGRTLVLLVAAALTLLAIVASAALTGADPFTRDKQFLTEREFVAPFLGGDDIAFVQARYTWDGSRDGYGAPTPTVEDPRIIRVSNAGGVPTFLAELPAAERQILVGFSTVGPAVRWSPDGSRIAFRLYNDATGIHVMNRDGSGLTRITDIPEPGGRSCVPTESGTTVTCYWERSGGFAWSPDGTRIAFTSPVGTDRPGGDKSSSLYVVDTSDGRLTKLTGPNAFGGAFPPIAWSPDGSRIAFARSRGPLRSSTNSLVVMDADGSHEAPLVEIYDVDLGPLAWSPDGSRIAFMRGSTTEGKDDGASGLWVVNSDGTDARRIKAEPFSTEVQAVHDGPFAWSPDGSWIARIGGPGDGAITLVAPDGSEERVIGEPGPGSGNRIEDFAWSPDGSQLVFSDGGGPLAESPPTWDPPSIYVIDVDGTGQRRIADGEYPDWSN